MAYCRCLCGRLCQHNASTGNSVHVCANRSANLDTDRNTSARHGSASPYNNPDTDRNISACHTGATDRILAHRGLADLDP